jgi:hypothetical protein
VDTAAVLQLAEHVLELAPIAAERAIIGHLCLSV